MNLDNWKRLAKIINTTPRTTAVTATTTCGTVVRVLSARMDAGGPEVYCSQKRTVYCTHIANLRSVEIGGVVYSDETMAVPEPPPGRKTTFGELADGDTFQSKIKEAPTGINLTPEMWVSRWAEFKKERGGASYDRGSRRFSRQFRSCDEVIVPEEAPLAAPSLPEAAKKITFREFL